MRRREFITLVGGAAATWPLCARAQQTGRLPTIGFFGAGTPSGQGTWAAALVQRLHELGWNPGSNVAIEYRWAEAHQERLPQIADEFVRMKVDVIVTAGTEATIAAKRATSAIPIVFGASADPIGTGLVASLAKPGGNVTGLSLQNADLAGKRFALLREVVPHMTRSAILAAAGDINRLELKQVQAAAGSFGLTVVTLKIRQGDEIAAAFDHLQDRADALYVIGAPLIVSNRIRINTFALTARLPTTYNSRDYVELGGLMSYGPNFSNLFRHAADYVDKILRGTKPTDLPVQQPTKFELVLNLTTAKALAVTIPPTLLAIADEVIE
jgi:putative tryptophan/tyrosine transport system substrate-binding protein